MKFVFSNRALTSELLSFLHVNFLSESMLTIKIPWWRKVLFLLLSRLSLDHLLAPLTQSTFLLFITHCMVSTVSSRATFTIKNFVVFGILASWIITLSFLEKKQYYLKFPFIERPAVHFILSHRISHRKVNWASRGSFFTLQDSKSEKLFDLEREIFSVLGAIVWRSSNKVWPLKRLNFSVLTEEYVLDSSLGGWF